MCSVTLINVGTSPGLVFTWWVNTGFPVTPAVWGEGGWLPGVTVLVGDCHPALPPVVSVLRKLPPTISKHGFTRKPPRILPLAATDRGQARGVALLPKHLFHQPSYLSFDTGAPLPCLR